MNTTHCCEAITAAWYFLMYSWHRHIFTRPLLPNLNRSRNFFYFLNKGKNINLSHEWNMFESIMYKVSTLLGLPHKTTFFLFMLFMVGFFSWVTHEFQLILTAKQHPHNNNIESICDTLQLLLNLSLICRLSIVHFHTPRLAHYDS